MEANFNISQETEHVQYAFHCVLDGICNLHIEHVQMRSRFIPLTIHITVFIEFTSGSDNFI